MTFNEFVGNELLKSQIIQLINNKKVPHCLILEGESGVGKKTFAQLMARLVLCDSEKVENCVECQSCKKIINGTHPDVIYPEKTGVLKTYNVDTVREIREDAYIKPNESAFKIYIFTDADDMNISSQNALLKVLEEPPENVIFIFTCKSRNVFLDTIKSRSQIFLIDCVLEKEAVDFISKNYKDFNILKIEKAVNETKGNIGKALNLLLDFEGEKAFSITKDLLKALVSPNEMDLVKASSKIIDKNLFKLSLNTLLIKLKDALVEKNDAEDIYLKLSKKRILNMIDKINEVNDMFNYNVNYNLLLTYLTSNLYKAAFLDIKGDSDGSSCRS